MLETKYKTKNDKHMKNKNLIIFFVREYIHTKFSYFKILKKVINLIVFKLKQT